MRFLPLVVVAVGGLLLVIGPVLRAQILAGSAGPGGLSIAQIAAGVVGVGLVLIGISLFFGLARTLFTGLGVCAGGGVLLISTGVLH